MEVEEDKLVEISKYRGQACWVQRGKFFYVVCRRRGDTLQYRCGTKGCTSGFLCRDDVLGALSTPHDHSEEPWIPDRNVLFRILRERSIAESTSLQTIYNEEAARRPEAASHLTIDNVMPSMRKWRRNAAHSDVPSNLIDYGTAVANRTGFETMYLCTVSAGGASAVILVMPGWAGCLRDSDTIIADGSIETIPAGVQVEQVLALHAVVGSQFFHPVLALLESRKQVLYEAVLRRVWREAGGPRPGALVADYEPALQAALQTVGGAPVAGCYYHMMQDLQRQARLCGLQVSPSSPGGQLVRLYGALALLPPAAAPRALPALQALALAERLPFSPALHQHYTSHWMTQVGPELFSVYKQPHRTSNAVESLHTYLRKMLGPAPNVWRFTHVVQQKFEICVARRQAQLSGAATTPRRGRACSLVRRSAAFNNLKALERGRIDLRQFLVSSSRSIRLIDDRLPAVRGQVEDILKEDEPGDTEMPEDIPEECPEKITETTPSQPEVPPQPSTTYDVRCSVCVDDDVQRVLVPCGHILCYECVRAMKRSDAPDKCSCCGEIIQMHAVLVR